ncbi:hypothetical protein [Pseudoruegeria sp. HB172150]|uniref:hypothetical protein n=1 Tax=Pseudoruegeria sp. HB172150 TaxID=2721164 RepID=UPI001556626B|nr:hypothetical protein [Pseudoruegeria sp. HB172150]
MSNDPSIAALFRIAESESGAVRQLTAKLKTVRGKSAENTLRQLAESIDILSSTLSKLAGMELPEEQSPSTPGGAKCDMSDAGHNLFAAKRTILALKNGICPACGGILPTSRANARAQTPDTLAMAERIAKARHAAQ